MPRAKKELESTVIEKKATDKVIETTKKVSRAKNSDTTKKIASKKSTTKKVVSDKKTPVKKVSSKTTTAKKPSTVTKPTKTAKAKTTKVSKTVTTKKAPAKKKITSPVDQDRFINILEYYDLPYRYNETVVKILAQTPKILFVYWDISDDDRKKYTDKYGEYYFNDSYPVLLVHNKTLNYTQEIEINDFANSWYISLPDSQCEYNVTLARRFKEYSKRNPDLQDKSNVNNAITVVSSNNLIMPNDHVLLKELKPEVKYRNVKTGKENFKNVRHILKDNNLIDFYGLYQQIYQVEDLTTLFTLTNPSSGNPTSTFK